MKDFVLTEGKVLRLLVYESERTVEDVAKSLGISRQQLNNLFNMNSITPKHRSRLAKILDVSEEVFFQTTLKEQVDSLQHLVKVLSAENEWLKAKVQEHEARIKTLEAENSYLRTKYN